MRDFRGIHRSFLNTRRDKKVNSIPKHLTPWDKQTWHLKAFQMGRGIRLEVNWKARWLLGAMETQRVMCMGEETRKLMQLLQLICMESQPNNICITATRTNLEQCSRKIRDTSNNIVLQKNSSCKDLKANCNTMQVSYRNCLHKFPSFTQGSKHQPLH